MVSTRLQGVDVSTKDQGLDGVSNRNGPRVGPDRVKGKSRSLASIKSLGFVIVALFLGFTLISVTADHMDSPTAPIVRCNWLVGELTDAATEDPVEGANVVAKAGGSGGGAILQGFASHESDSDGVYRLHLSNGPWNVSIEHPDYAPDAFDVWMPCGDDDEEVQEDRQLQPLTLDVDGTVTVVVKENRGELEPVAVVGETVRLVLGSQCEGSNLPEHEDDTNEQGQATLQGVPPGNHCIVFDSLRYDPVTAPVNVEELDGPVEIETNRVLVEYAGSAVDGITGDFPSPPDRDDPVILRAFHPVFCPGGTPLLDRFDCHDSLDGEFSLELPWDDEIEYELVFAHDDSHYFPIIDEVDLPGPDADEVDEATAELEDTLDDMVENEEARDAAQLPDAQVWVLDRRAADVTGTVTGGEPSAGLENAEVCLIHSSISSCDLTDENGAYSVRVAWGEGFTLRAEMDGFRDAIQEGVTIELAGPNTNDISLIEAGMGSVTGTVNDGFGDNSVLVSDGFSPLVELLDETGGVVTSTQVDSEDEFTLSANEGSGYTVQVSDPRYGSYTSGQSFSILDDQVTEYPSEISLERNIHELVVTLIDGEDSEHTMEGAVIELDDHDNNSQITTYINDHVDREQTADALGEVSYSLPWDPDGYKFDLNQQNVNGVVFPEIEDRSLDIAMDAASSVSESLLIAPEKAIVQGNVKDEDADHVIDAVLVSVTNAENLKADRYGLTTPTDTNGDYSLTIPEDWETYELLFEHTDYMDEDDEEVTASQSDGGHTLDVELRRLTWTVTGNLVDVDENGNEWAVEDANVVADETTSSIREDDESVGDGGFSLTLPWGLYDVTISRDNYIEETLADVDLRPPLPAERTVDLGIINLERSTATISGALLEDRLSSNEEIEGRTGGIIATCTSSETSRAYEVELVIDDQEGTFTGLTLPDEEGTPAEGDLPTDAPSDPAYLCDLVDGEDEFHPLMGVEIFTVDDNEPTDLEFHLERKSWTIKGQVLEAPDDEGVGTLVCAGTVSLATATDEEIEQTCTESDDENGLYSLTVEYHQQDEPGLRMNQVILTALPERHLPGSNTTMIGPDSGANHPFQVDISVLPSEFDVSHDIGCDDENAQTGELACTASVSINNFPVVDTSWRLGCDLNNIDLGGNVTCAATVVDLEGNEEDHTVSLPIPNAGCDPETDDDLDPTTGTLNCTAVVNVDDDSLIDEQHELKWGIDCDERDEEDEVGATCMIHLEMNGEPVEPMTFEVDSGCSPGDAGLGDEIITCRIQIQNGDDTISVDETKNVTIPENPVMAATINGTVTDGDAKEDDPIPDGIPGAVVTATPPEDSECGGVEYTTVTDALGSYILLVQCPGEYDVSVGHPLYEEASRPIEVEVKDVQTVLDGPESIEEDFVLARHANDASVRVRGPTSFVKNAQVNIKGIDVSFEPDEPIVTGGASSDEGEGVALFFGVPWGSYEVQVVGPEGETGMSILNVYPALVEDQDGTLMPKTFVFIP